MNSSYFTEPQLPPLASEYQLVAIDNPNLPPPTQVSHFGQHPPETEPIFLFFQRLVGPASLGHYYRQYTSHHYSAVKTIAVPKKTLFDPLPARLIEALVHHLRVHFHSAIFHFYEYLKSKATPLSTHEIMLAHGGQGITPKVIKGYMIAVGCKSRHLNDSAHQPDVKVLICKWLALTDQMVKTTQTPEFRRLFGRELPSGDELKATIEEMADKVVTDARQTIEGLVGGVALSVGFSTLASSKLQGSKVVAAVLAHYSSPEGIISPSPRSDQCLRHTAQHAATRFLQEFSALESQTLHTNTTKVTGVLTKLRRAIRYIMGCPSREWEGEIHSLPHNLRCLGLALILDDQSKPWPTTGQMIGRALYLRPIIESFILRRHPSSQAYELSNSEWEELVLLSATMNKFAQAIDRMTTTYKGLSGNLFSTSLPHIMHDTYRGLVKMLGEIIGNDLQNNSLFRSALLVSYEILRKNCFGKDAHPLYVLSALFDPRIGFRGLAEEPEFEREAVVAAHAYIQQLFREVYPDPLTYLEAVQQLDQYKVLPIQAAKTHPTLWWNSQKFNYPLLYPIVLDVLSIPGSVNAAERHCFSFHDPRTVVDWDIMRNERRAKEALNIIKYNLDHALEF
ncbi:hypothetical protein PQX77_004308 [Marasmius sp. AFHP31]|nr:hypothetical protein PQX77_004308 [Marasmius sp. AFHP31]